MPAGTALAQRLELQAGICRESKGADGSWWRSNYEHSIDLTSGCWQLGISDRPWKSGDWIFGWRASWIDLGRGKANTVFPMLDGTSNPTGKNCDPKTMSGCLGRGIMATHTFGASLSGLVEREWKQITWGAELGIWAQYSRFDVRVTPEMGASFPSSEQHWGSWTFKPFAGINARYQYLIISGRLYPSTRSHEYRCGGCTGINNGLASAVLVGVSIPLK